MTKTCVPQMKTVSATGDKTSEGYAALKDPEFEELGYPDMVMKK